MNTHTATRGYLLAALIILISVVALALPTATWAAEISSVKSGDWSSSSTWDNGVPTEYDEVTIGMGHTVTYDVESDDIIQTLMVMGTLQFATDQDTELTADEVMVLSSGTFQIGTEANPLPRKYDATVNLTGQEEEIMIMGGTFEIHGANVDTTWTRLRKTAKRGSSTLKLKKAVDWKVGDYIVIASTSFESDEAETRYITAIQDGGKTLKLNEPLYNKHYAKHYQYAEVGLLSRNIMFQGDDEFDAGHIMFMVDESENKPTVHVEYARFDTLGTFGTLAQYPLHFHVIGDAPNNAYITGNSITNSSNRCITVHGTNNVLVNENVTYNTKGHCYFLEDGVEQNNVFDRNLGVLTTDGATLSSDGSPSTFWITNPKNTFTNNVAAGSEGSGFWFDLLSSPTGLHEDVDLEPNRLRLKKFHGNVAHSNGRNGIDVDDYYKPDARAVFTDILAYKNKSQGIWARGRDMTFKNATLVDNRVGAAFAAQDTKLTKSLVIGNSKASSPFWGNHQLGFTFYDGPVHVERTTFKRFKDKPGDREFAAVSIRQNNPYQMSQNNSFKNLKFQKARKFWIQDVERNGETFAVLNNSKTGETLLPYHEFHADPRCTYEKNWNLYRCSTIKYGRLTVTDQRKNFDEEFTITRKKNGGKVTLVEEGSSHNGRWVMSVPEGETFKLSPKNADELKIKLDRSKESVTVRVPYTSKPSQITEAGYDHAGYWSYDKEAKQVVLEVRPNREYIIYK